MKKEKKYGVLFTDCLCFESFFSAGPSQAIACDWYFISESKIFAPFRKILSKLVGVNFRRLDDISYSDASLGKSSLYESIQDETKATIKELLASDILGADIMRFTNNLKLNKDKANHFLTVHYFPYVYRLIELKNLSHYLNVKNAKILILDSPISLYTSDLRNLSISNYQMFISNLFGIKDRDDYFYDYTHVMKPYFRSRRFFFFKEILKSILLVTYSISFKGPKENTRKERYLGIEMLQRRINPKATNDLFFARNEELKDSECCLIEESIFTSHYKKDSYDVIKSRAFRRLKFFNYSTFLSQKRDGEIDREYRTYFLLKVVDYKIYFTKIFSFLYYPFSLSPNKRLNAFLLEKYDFESYIWSEIYNKFNISLVWTMLDGGYQQVIKSQAIERNNGLYCGSHWSNYPMILVFNYKPYDVIFSWSDHFEHLFVNEFPHPEKYKVGYTSSDYFEHHRSSAKKLRGKYPQKIIITFNDNIFHNDIAISESNYDDFYNLATTILDQNEDIIVFIKPKRASLFHEKAATYNKLRRYIENGRARLFSPENERSKITPSELAMASDLVIGLGNSTTTLESFISGTPAINLDLCKFSNNEFCDKAKNKVVFDDPNKILHLIKEYRTKAKELILIEQQNYYKILDPFLDESSGNRIAKKLKNILNRKSNLDKLN